MAEDKNVSENKGTEKQKQQSIKPDSKPLPTFRELERAIRKKIDYGHKRQRSK